MASQHPIEVTVSFKIILKEVLEKLNLPPAIYECKKHGPDHDPIFRAFVILDDGHEKNSFLDQRSQQRKKRSESLH